MFIYRNFFLDTQESVDLVLKSEIIIEKPLVGQGL